ncbi:DUF6506 family protein [Brevibacterium sp. 50QC2O2]|uniref:DUF6506 family protein n=1 Tax=Brevibacterium TaxID=1696 RepID=UPI00211CA3E6|nr:MULTISPECIES: DUF6506 family protein [unclassified Brevibacterium]MCQ9366642.1 DUF6506 family protein [Brevibacterium sp. 91QC2O2]MCQ9384476.1 DUF6506 family protein [Brevibacterium sp. 68QC2CO]MCQ9389618.1 DUF6506 family protein [Brevibacterium sp. 50QC2O2]
MKLKAAFIFLAPGADWHTDRQTVETPGVDLTVVGAADYADSEAAARELAAAGVGAIELCGGFGIEGTARIKAAVPDTVAVGVVRFENHPGLEYKSGDQLFG